jgi:hypothetical protein
MHIKFQKNGMTKEVKRGFSWTVFFFGPLCLLFRGMWAWAFALLVVNIMTGGFFQLIAACFINRKYAYHLAKRGWQVTQGDSNAALAAWGISAPQEC